MRVFHSVCGLTENGEVNDHAQKITVTTLIKKDKRKYLTLIDDIQLKHLKLQRAGRMCMCMCSLESA